METDFKTPREKENIYKEFERYDEKYSHLKPETNCKEAKETKNRRNIFKQVNILYISKHAHSRFNEVPSF